ncbi:unnamed protein product [Cercopithifilaria johnstoni]|uniref:Uncharacterized protein n=1 Tax=Cercopithifilaria johnstoni TaxID=2874296 RepID=A0A8J2MK20_9BILA|nr:unnamed protein product [Cercopithifilaria johnstoni]
MPNMYEIFRHAFHHRRASPWPDGSDGREEPERPRVIKGPRGDMGPVGERASCYFVLVEFIAEKLKNNSYGKIE